PPPVAGKPGGEHPLAHHHGYHFLEPVQDPEASLASLQGARRSEIFLEPLDTSVLFVPGPGRPLAVTLPPSWYFATPWPLLIGPDEELIARSRPGSLHYPVYSAPAAPDPTQAQASAGPLPPELAPYLQLPQNLPPRITALAQKITAD